MLAGRESILACVLLVGLALAPASGQAEADGPDFFRVTGVAPGDVLSILARAGAGTVRIGSLPHDADGVRNLGCVGGLSLSEWQVASEAERAAAVSRRWCRVAYRGIEGWVAGRFLGEGTTPVPGGGSVWRVVRVDGETAAPEAVFRFTPTGDLGGTLGCNAFTARVAVADGVLSAAGPVAATRMACADEAAARHDSRVFESLGKGVVIAYDPHADRLGLLGPDGRAVLELTRLPP